MRAAQTAVLLVLLFSSAVLASLPGEVPPTAVFLADGSSLTWSAVAGATSYNVYKGTSPGSPDHLCRIVHTAGTSAPLPEIPAAPGGLLYFLISAVNAEGEGGLGETSDGSPRPNLSPCVDSDGDLVPDNLDNCLFSANPSQADQDDNGVGDRCDPNTYDFEADAAGSRPTGMTQLGGTNTTFTVKDLDGDHAVSYATGSGAHDRFENLLGGMPFQNTTMYVDFDTASPEVCSMEVWSEGAFGWNAGGGLILQVSSSGGLTFYERHGQQVPATGGPAAPASGRMRLRLIKGSGSTSTLHVDSWDGAAFQPDLAVFSVADDHRYHGLGSVLADYLNGARGVKRVTILHEVPPGDLVLRKDPTWSSDWKLFQRGGQDRADIPLRFFYRLESPGRAQARVLRSSNGSVLPGHDWTDHVALLGAADGVAGNLDVSGVPAGGNYDIQLRLVRDEDGAVLATATLDEVAVGDLYVSGGQSNMSGYSGTLDNSEPPIDEVHLFHNDGTWKRASEPMDDGTDQVDLVSAESPQHSLMLRFAKEVFQARGIPVGVVVGPLGGTNLYTQWQRDESDHDNRGTLYGSLLHRGLLQGSSVAPKGFLWFQGESDSGRTTGQYKTDLKRLIGEYREDFGNPSLYFLIAQLGTYDAANLEDWLAIQEAQRQVVEEDPLTALIPTVDQPRADVIHFNVQGYKTIGLRFGEAARQTIYGEPLDASLRLTEARLSGHQRSVELVYDGNVTGGQISLYRVRDSIGPVGVRSVSTSGNIVTVGLDQRLGSGGLISYGYSTTPNVQWVKDLRGTPVPSFRRVPIAP